MNRSIRNNIARVTRRTVAAIRQNAYELSSALESAKSEEEAKLDSMPKSFSGSSKAGDMEEAVGIFNDALVLISVPISFRSISLAHRVRVGTKLWLSMNISYNGGRFDCRNI